MSLPDIILDVAMATGSQDIDQKDQCSHTSTDSGMAISQESYSEKTVSPELPSPHSSRSTPSSRSHRSARSRCSMISVDSCDSDCLSSLDEGEAAWDALGRMSSVRRSNRFDKPQLLTLSLARGPDGFGLELGGRSPPIMVDVFGDAKKGGIRPGDQLLEVNGISVRGVGHKEAGKLIAEGSDTVTLLVHTVKPTPTPDGQVIYSGWLMKRGGSGMTPRNWRRRWFVVRDDCIAYYYRSASDTRPMGAIVLRNYTVSKACHDCRKPFAFKMVKGGARSYYFSADTDQEMNKWAQVFTEAATLEGRESVHFSGSSHNVSLSALAIKDPDCHGWMHKQGHGIKSWKRRYCVLKNHQLFYYGKMSHTTAYGVMNLRGYKIVVGKTKDKKHQFQALPPDSSMREYRFYTETEGERERWIEAMRRSITRAR